MGWIVIGFDQSPWRGFLRLRRGAAHTEWLGESVQRRVQVNDLRFHSGELNLRCLVLHKILHGCFQARFQELPGSLLACW